VAQTSNFLALSELATTDILEYFNIRRG